METKLHGDLYRDSESSTRTTEAVAHLNRIYTVVEGKTGQDFRQGPQSILEVGSGQGNVTRALQQVVPEGTITALDYDSDPRVAEAAVANGVPLVVHDATTMTDEVLGELIREKGITQVSALRTSPAVAQHLSQALQRIQFPGIFYFSLVGATDPEAIEAFSRQAREGQCKRIALQEGRGILSETGFVFLPHPMPITEE